MHEFKDVKITPVSVTCTITYSLEVSSSDALEQAKEDFEESVERLRMMGSADVEWE